ncbi:MAG: SAP domain-containing protein [Pseudomonadota bacterium]
MEHIEKPTRVLDLMVEAMDGRSMDRLVQEWNDWDAPRVQRPAIHRWLRRHPRTNPVNLIRFLRVEQLREICFELGMEDDGDRQDLVRRVLIEALVDEEALSPDSVEAQEFRQEILDMCDDGEEAPTIRAADAARLPQPYLTLVPSGDR